MKAFNTFFILILVSFLLFSCASDVEPGSFSLSFVWQDPPPADKSALGIWGKVEQDGRQVAISDIKSYADGAELDFSNIPNGSGLVVTIEIRESTEASGRALYFGKSKPFELKAGEHTSVEVSLSLTETPLAEEFFNSDGDVDTETEIETDGTVPVESASVQIVKKDVDGKYQSIGYTNVNVITISLEKPKNCDDPCTVIVSNTSDFTSLLSELPLLKDLELFEDRYIVSDWDLNRGVPDNEGVRTVYVKYRNEYGYESSAHTAQVVIDRVAPDVASGAVSPAYTNSQISITLTPNDTLLSDSRPVLSVYKQKGDIKLKELEMIASGGGESFSVKEKTLAEIFGDPSTLDEETLYFKLTMTDKAGNETDGEVLFDDEKGDKYTTTIDLTAPVITEPIEISPDKTHLKKGETLLVSFGLEEKNEDRLSVKAGSASMAISNTREDKSKYSFSISTDSVDEGLAAIVVEATDMAGNTVSKSLGTVTFDFTKPDLDLSAEPKGTPIKSGGLLTLILNSGSDLLDPASLKLVAKPELQGTLSDPVGEGTEFRWNYTVEASDSGEVEFTVSASDKAGNAANESTVKVLFDGKTPELIASTVNIQTQKDGKIVPNTRALKDGDEIEVSFKLNEDLGTGKIPSLLFGTKELGTMSVNDKNDFSWVWNYTVKKSDWDNGGVKSFVLNLEDAAGNKSTNSEDFDVLTLDFETPTLLVTVDPDSSIAALGQTVTVTVRTDNSESIDPNSLSLRTENLDSSSDMTGSFGNAKGSGGEYRFSYEVVDGEAGKWKVFVSCSDLAGNVAEEASATMQTDGIKPSITKALLSATRVTGTERTYTFTLDFDVADNGSSDDLDIAVSLSDDNTYSGVMTKKVTRNSLSFIYELTVDVNDIDPNDRSEFFTSAITITDTAGNNVQKTTNTLKLDIEVPSVESLDITPDHLKAGDELKAILTANEKLSGPPVLKAVFDDDKTNRQYEIVFTADSSAVAGQLRYVLNATWPDPLPDSGSDYVYRIEPFILTDEQGNANPSANTDTIFTVDRTIPALVDFTIDPISGTVLNNQKTITVSFNDNELGNPAEGWPKVKLGYYDFVKQTTRKQRNGYEYVYTYMITGDESEGNHELSIELRDPVGNVTKSTTGDIGSYKLDFTAPGLTIDITPDRAVGSAQVLKIKAKANEELDVNNIELSTTPSWTTLGNAAKEGDFWVWEHTVSEGEEASYQLDFTATDVAGNRIEPAIARLVKLDGLLPKVVDGSVVYSFTKDGSSQSSDVPLQDGDKLEVSFRLNKATNAPNISFGGNMLGSITETNTETHEWLWSYTVNKANWEIGQSSYADGVKTILLQVSDTAQNSANITADFTPVTLDFANPTLTLTVEPDGRPAGKDETVTITVTASESLKDDPTLISNPTWANLAGPTQNGGSYIWTATVAEDETGTYNLSVTADDEAGNTSDAATASVTLDGVVPDLKTGEAVTVTIIKGTTNHNDNPPAKDADKVEVRFVVNKAINNPNLSIGGKRLGTVSEESDKHWLWSYTVDKADWALGGGGYADGVKSLQIDLSDSAQNSNTLASGLPEITLDFANPTLTLTIAPDGRPAGKDQTVTISVTASESLKDDPTLISDPTWSNLSGPTQNGGSYIWTASVAEDETGTYNLSVTADDAAGNTSDAATASVTLDGIVPDLKTGEDVTVTIIKGTTNHTDNPPAKDADKVEVRFVVNKTISNPSISIGGKRLGSVSEESDKHWLWSYTVDKSDWALGGGGYADGVKSLQIDLSDSAQNSNTLASELPEITLDFANPTLTLTVEPDGRPAGKDQTVTITVTASETLDGDPTLVSNPSWTNLSGPTQNGGSYIWTTNVAEDETGTYNLSVTADDAAGNTSDAATASVTLDGIVPDLKTGEDVTVTIIKGTTNHTDNPPAKDADKVEVRFVVNKTISNPSISIGGKRLGSVSEESDKHWLWSYTVDKSDWALGGGGYADGVKSLQIDLSDSAQNSNTLASELPEITLDFANPTLTLTVEPDGRPAGKDQTVTITVTASETLDGDPTLVSNPSWTNLSGPTQNGGSYIWTTNVAEDETGTYNLSVTADDAAGNTSDAATASVTLDGIVPDLKTGEDVTVTIIKGTTNHTDNPPAKDADKVEVRFVVNKTISNPSISIGGKRLGSVSEESDKHWLWSYTVDKSDWALGGGGYADGVKSLQIDLSDSAQNSNTLASGLPEITLMLDDPTLAGFEVSPGIVKGGSSVKVVLTSTSLLAAPPVIVAGSTTRITFTASSNTPATSYTYSGSVLTTAAEETYSFDDFVLVDKAGNSDTVSAPQDATFKVDNSAPEIKDITLSGTRFKSGETCTVSFNVDEDNELSDDPTVLVGGRAFTKITAISGFEYTYQFTTDSTKDSHGVNEISITATDEVGKSGLGRSNITFDFNAPQIVTAICSPDLAKHSEYIYCQVTLDEVPANGNQIELFATTSTRAQIDFGTSDTISGDNLTYTWKHQAGPFESNKYTTVNLDKLEDDLGNSTCNDQGQNCEVTTGADFEIDSAIPTLSGERTVDANDNVTTRFSGKTGFNKMFVKFTLSDTYVSTYGSPTVNVYLDSISLSCTNSGADYSCNYTLSPIQETEGFRSVSISVTDYAGNKSLTTTLQVEFDLSAPEVINAVCSPDLAKKDDYVNCQVILDEVPANGNQIELFATTSTRAQIDFGTPDSVSGDNLTYTWRHQAATGESDNYTIVKLDKLEDDLGNSTCNDQGQNCKVTTGADFEIDATLPAIASAKIVDSGDTETSRFSGETGFNKMFVKFTLNDTYKSSSGSPTVSVYLGSDLMTCTASGSDYTCEKTVSNLNDDEGSHSISISVTDYAGNKSNTTTLPVEFDFSAPQVINTVVTPDPAPLGADIWYQVTLNESARLPDIGEDEPHLVATKQTRATGTIDFSVPINIDTDREVFEWEHNVALGQTGNYTVKITKLCDELDNCAENITADLEGFEIDALVPGVPTITTSWDGCSGDNCNIFSGNDPYNKMDIEVTFGQAPDSYKVTVDGTELAANKCSASGSPTVYLCEDISVSGSAGESGTRIITATYADAAGNSNDADHQVYYDFDPPEVSNSYYSPDPANLGSTISYYITTDEDLSTSASTLTLTIDPTLSSFGSYSGSGQSFNWTRSVEVSSGDNGSHDVTVTKLCDNYGNCASNVATEAIIVDALASEISGLKVCRDDGTTNACSTEEDTFSANTNFKEMKISFTLSEAPDGFPDIEVGDDTISSSSCTVASNVYVCSYVVTDPDSGTNPRVDTAAISITTTDSAGNVDFASQVVTYDFQPPEVIGDALAERCDNYEPAKDENDTSILYLKNGSNCSTDTDACQYKGTSCPYEVTTTARGTTYAPARIIFSMTENVKLGDNGIYINKTSGSELIVDDYDYTNRDYQQNFSAYYNTFTDGEANLDVFANLIDETGNEIDIKIGEFKFDYTPPDPPSQTTDTNIIYTRIPWGSDANGGTSEIKVRSESTDAFGCTSGMIKVYNYSPEVELGSANCEDFDSSTKSIEFGSNPAKVKIAQLDEAGNESQRVKVRNVEWTGTMGYKLRGRTEENPNVMKDAPYFRSEVLKQNPDSTFEASQADIDKLAVIDGSAMIKEAEQNWQERFFDGTKPPGRNRFGMAYDSIRGKVVVFAGSSTTQENDTWEWDSTERRWRNVTPEGENPPKLDQFDLVFDSWRGKTVLFGGHDGAGSTQDTWEWNGSKWQKVTPAGDNPPIRYRHAMAFDSIRGKVVLFGGSNTHRYQDTWEWDGTKWEEIIPTGNIPDRREHNAMAFDPTRGKVVLFGGVAYDENNNKLATRQDTWEWDGTTWVKLTGSSCTGCNQCTSTTCPSGRYGTSLAYDKTRGKIILFGGLYYNTKYNDTWEWNGTNWTEISISGGKPASRGNHEIVFDNVREKVLLFGGGDKDWNIKLSDTWELSWNNNIGTWTEVVLSTIKPSYRNENRMAYDRENKKVVMHGGSESPKNDTWVWDGTKWEDKSPTSGLIPESREGYGIDFDTKNKKVLLFDGDNKGDIWEWDGSSWNEIISANGIKPPGRTLMGFAYDSDREKAVVFGGYSSGGSKLNDTWEFGVWGASVCTNDTDRCWKQITPSGDKPEIRQRPAMAYDANRKKIVLHGGRGNGSFNWLGDTWEWDGTKWEKLYGITCTGCNICTSTTCPSSRDRHQLVYDSDRKQIVMFGGKLGLNDLWQYDASGWKEMTPNGIIPKNRYAYGMAYDSDRHKMVLFGGESNLDDTWELDNTIDKTSATIFEATFGHALPENNSTYKSLDVKVYSGGSAYSDPGNEDGSKLYVWNNLQNAWQLLGTPNASSIDNPSEITYATSGGLNETKIENLITGSDMKFNFAITSSHPSGSGHDLAKVSVDYVEATVKYKLPE